MRSHKRHYVVFELLAFIQLPVTMSFSSSIRSSACSPLAGGSRTPRIWRSFALVLPLPTVLLEPSSSSSLICHEMNRRKTASASRILTCSSREIRSSGIRPSSWFSARLLYGHHDSVSSAQSRVHRVSVPARGGVWKQAFASPAQAEVSQVRKRTYVTYCALCTIRSDNPHAPAHLAACDSSARPGATLKMQGP